MNFLARVYFQKLLRQTANIAVIQTEKDSHLMKKQNIYKQSI